MTENTNVRRTLKIVVSTALMMMGSCSSTDEPDLEPDRRDGDLVTIRGLALHIDVTDEFPLAGATISVYGGAVAEKATTDKEGRFQLRIPRSTQFIHASAPGYWGNIQHVDAAAPSSIGIEMALATDQFIANEGSALGLIVDETKGFVAVHFDGHEGSESITIDAQSEQPYSFADGKRILGNHLTDNGVPDREGEMIFPLVDVGDISVAVNGGPDTVCTLPTDIKWPVIAKTLTSVEAECSELTEMSGRVVDDQDHGVPNADVSVELSHGKIGNYTVDYQTKPWEGSSLQAITNTDGDFVLTVPPGTHFVHVQADGHWGTLSMIEIEDEEEHEGEYVVFHDSVIEERFFDSKQANKSLGIFALSSPAELWNAEIRRGDTMESWTGNWFVGRSPIRFLHVWFGPMVPGQVAAIHGDVPGRREKCKVTMNPWEVRANTVTIGTSVCRDAE